MTKVKTMNTMKETSSVVAHSHLPDRFLCRVVHGMKTTGKEFAALVELKYGHRLIEGIHVIHQDSNRFLHSSDHCHYHIQGSFCLLLAFSTSNDPISCLKYKCTLHPNHVSYSSTAVCNEMQVDKAMHWQHTIHLKLIFIHSDWLMTQQGCFFLSF